MASLDRPKLRPLSAKRFEHDGRLFVALEDPHRVIPQPILIPIEGYQRVVSLFDGRTTLVEIQARLFRESGEWISLSELELFVLHLDRVMVLDGPTFEEFQDTYRRERVRPAAFAGRSYASTERALRSQLCQFFSHTQGAGWPISGSKLASNRLRGILSPHIDFFRGGTTYTWSYKELVEHSDAEVFVILGVAHQYCRNRFALTTKDFETPLGLVPTERSYVDQLAALAGSELLDDELSHRTEHSIEFQVVFLQYLLSGLREFSIVPILVGSFHDLMEARKDPIESPDVRRFVDALHAAESACEKKVAYIGGIDLCHVGPQFGDIGMVGPDQLEEVRQFDATMLDRATARDPSGWFGTAARINNRLRVCGLAATYTMLHAMGPASGRLLRYDQALDDERTCCVSFASVAFLAPDESGSNLQAEQQTDVG